MTEGLSISNFQDGSRSMTERMLSVLSLPEEEGYFFNDWDQEFEDENVTEDNEEIIMPLITNNMDINILKSSQILETTIEKGIISNRENINGQYNTITASKMSFRTLGETLFNKRLWGMVQHDCYCSNPIISKEVKTMPGLEKQKQK